MEIGARWSAAQRANVPPFYVMEMIEAVSQRRASGAPVYALHSGQPATGAPEPVRREAIRLLDSGDPLGYTPAVGVPELREAIAGHYRDWYDIEIDADDVVITTGASGGFLLAFLAAFEPGDVVAMARPNYPCYRNVLEALGCTIVEIETGPETRFQPTVAQLAAIPNLKGLLLASAANPTGTMLSGPELAALVSWCDEAGVQLISDEIYHGLEYGEPGERLSRTAWETSRRPVVFGSFSKYFSMTGWRLGWMLAPAHLRRSVEVLTGNFTICPPALSQYAAVQAFSEEARVELDGHVSTYRENRMVMLDRLTAMGIDKLAPADGAFYVWADVSHLTEDTMVWSKQLLADTGVSVAPGLDFDTTEGHKYARFSFAGDLAEMTAGLDALESYIS